MPANNITLSQEQTKFIQTALQGMNILVDACIGSGKTTAIQELCNAMPRSKRILYLTYNKLLKVDAKTRITGSNVYVTNYHGFGYIELMNSGIRAGVSDIIQTYNQVKPNCSRFDVLILDEYQDIEEETSEMLRHIKNCNPGIQIIAVGDMAQKIYDKTVLNASVFIDRLLGSYVRMEFTLCFRLSHNWAEMLGRIWGKNIIGVNKNCYVRTMSYEDAFDFLKMQKPKDILCLGSNHAQRSQMLNDLESAYPSRFNKNTVWSKVSEGDGGATQPTSQCAVFTTFDGCKGMERDICVVFDWSENYWHTRTTKPAAKYEILRNIFCVAASRGKQHIIFVQPKKGKLLTEYTLSKEFEMRTDFPDMDAGSMFDYKYAEDVEAAYRQLEINEIQPIEAPIDLPIRDGMIDLSMCIGLCMKADYFTGFDIDNAIENFFKNHPDVQFKRIKDTSTWSVEQKILYLTMLTTNQNRYWNQVSVQFMTPSKRTEIQTRLSRILPVDAKAQVSCTLDFKKFKVNGCGDVVYNNALYDMHFTAEIQHNQFLSAAMQGLALNLKEIYVWNLYNNQMFQVVITDKRAVLNAVTRAATKGALSKFPGLNNQDLIDEFITDNYDTCVEFAGFVAKYIKNNKTQPPIPKVYEFFKKRNLRLPMNTKQFCRLFGPTMQKLSQKESA